MGAPRPLAGQVSVVELARLLHPANSQRRLMALLRTYFDASFTDIPGVTAIAGYIGTDAQWAEVEAKWTQNLRYWQLDDFHLANLPHQMGRFKADLCAKSFANIIEPSGLFHLDATLVDADWDNLDRDDEHKEKFPHRYHACLYMLFSTLKDAMRLDFEGDQVAIVLDDDIKPPDAAQAIFNMYKEGGESEFAALAFSDRRKCVPLQSADLIVG